MCKMHCIDNNNKSRCSALAHNFHRLLQCQQEKWQAPQPDTAISHPHQPLMPLLLPHHYPSPLSTSVTPYEFNLDSFSADVVFEDFMNDSPVHHIQAFERAHAAHEAEEDWDQAERDAEEEKQFQAIIIQSPTPSPGSLAAKSPPASNLLAGWLPETEEEEEEQLQAALVASCSSSSSFSTPSHGTSSSILPWNHFMAGSSPPSSAVPASKVTQISGQHHVLSFSCIVYQHLCIVTVASHFVSAFLYCYGSLSFCITTHASLMYWQLHREQKIYCIHYRM